MGVGEKSMELAFATVPPFFFLFVQMLRSVSPDPHVHVTAWTQHAPFTVLDPITLMKEVCIIP